MVNMVRLFRCERGGVNAAVIVSYSTASNLRIVSENRS